MVQEVSKNLIGKKFVSNAVFFLFFLVVFGAILVSAAPILDQLHLNIQTTDGSGNVVTGTFNFVFNISTDASCTTVVYSNSTTLATDSRGIISYYLENTNLDYDQQYYLCYYRDGSLIETSEISRTPYSFTALNTTVSGLIVDSNLNLGAYNASASWFNGLFNWTTADLYNTFNGYSLSFNESKLNQTIESFGYVTSSLGNATYVPYTGANSNVNIGIYNLTASYFFGDGSGLTGITGGQLGLTHLSNFTDDLGNRGYTHLTNFTNDLGIGNWSADSGNYYNTTQTDSQISSANTSLKNYVDTNYVPYSGASSNVNLGSYNLTAAYLFGDASGLTNINKSSVNYWALNGNDVYYNSGNVGIGTSSPTNNFTVIGEGNFTTNLYVGGTNVGIWLYNQTTPAVNTVLGFNYYNSTTLTTNSQLANGNNYWNDTYATFNKTYADTLYYGIGNPSGYIDWSVATNGTLYLSSNPSGFYNSTTLQNVSQLNNDNNYYNSTTFPSRVSGSGTAGYVPVWNGTTSINNSVIFQSGSNVGIGTTSPGEQLHLYRNDSTTAYKNNLLIEQDGTGDASLRFLLTGVQSYQIGIDNTNNFLTFGRSSVDLATNPIMVMDTSGKIGIGTTAPSGLLEVNAGTDNTKTVLFGGTSNSAKYNFTNLGSSTENRILTFTGRSLQVTAVSDSSVQPLILQPSGSNVGIGTTTPGYKLDVAGSINSYNLLINGTAAGTGNITGSGTANYLSKFTATGNIANSNVYDDGTNVGIGTTAPTSKLHVVGEVNITSSSVKMFSEGGALVVEG